MWVMGDMRVKATETAPHAPRSMLITANEKIAVLMNMSENATKKNAVAESLNPPLVIPDSNCSGLHLYHVMLGSVAQRISASLCGMKGQQS